MILIVIFMDIVELGLLFYLCSFFGYIYELILTYIFTNKIYSHGMFKGIFLPIYGIGSVLIVTFLNKYKNNILKFIISSFFLTGIFEYIGGALLLKVFKMRLWDYTCYKFNINGLVCPLSAFCFTIGSMLIIYGIYPLLKKIISKIKRKYLDILLCFLNGIFCYNIIATLKK